MDVRRRRAEVSCGPAWRAARSRARVDLSRTYGMLTAVVFGVLAVWGFIESGYDAMGIFAVGTAGNIIHAVIALLGALTAAMPEGVQREAGRGQDPARQQGPVF